MKIPVPGPQTRAIKSESLFCENESQATDREKIFAKDISDIGLASRITLTTQLKKNPIF